MINLILEDKNILTKFPELAPLFELKIPDGKCKPCQKGAFLHKAGSLFKEIISEKNIKEEDIRAYFEGKYGVPSISLKGIVGYTNSILRRKVSAIKGEQVYVDESVYLSRLATCRKCIFFDKGICTDCTCPVHEKCKRYTDSCPKNFWEE